MFCKKYVLKNSQTSQENTCVGASFLIKVFPPNFTVKGQNRRFYLNTGKDGRIPTLSKKRLRLNSDSCTFWENLRTFFYRTPPAAASANEKPFWDMLSSVMLAPTEKWKWSQHYIRFIGSCKKNTIFKLWLCKLFNPNKVGLTR